MPLLKHKILRHQVAATNRWYLVVVLSKRFLSGYKTLFGILMYIRNVRNLIAYDGNTYASIDIFELALSTIYKTGKSNLS